MKKRKTILFVHPNGSKKIYQDLSKDFSAIEPPIWALMLAKRARIDGIECDVLDCEALRKTSEQSIEEIKEIAPDICAIVVYGQQPSASTQNMVGAEEISKGLKDTNIQVLFIGAHPSALPERTLKDNPWAYICQGEGPETVRALCYNEALENVPGLWYLDLLDLNVIKRNPTANLIQDLDHDLPGCEWLMTDLTSYRTANWHALTNNGDRGNFASIYTSLGCPFDCKFCMINTPFGGSSFRYWTPEFTVKQLKYLADHDVKNLKIADEMFVLKRDHFLRICNLIIEAGLKFNIWAYARIDTIKEEYLDILKKAGVNWLALGIESASKNIRLEATKGKFEDVKIQDIVSKIHKHDIAICANYIFGLPRETTETMQSTIDLALELNTEYANFYSAMPYPGSHLYSETPEEYRPENNGGWVAYSQHSWECFPLPGYFLSNREILSFRDTAFKTYFSNPKYIEMIKQKYGDKALEGMTNMMKYNLKRKLYGDTNEQ